MTSKVHIDIWIQKLFVSIELNLKSQFNTNVLTQFINL